MTLESWISFRLMLQLQLACESRLSNQDKMSYRAQRCSPDCATVHKNIGFSHSHPRPDNGVSIRQPDDAFRPDNTATTGSLEPANRRLLEHCLSLVGRLWIPKSTERTRLMQLAVELACSVSQREWSVPRPRGSPASNAREQNLLLAAPTTSH